MATMTAKDAFGTAQTIEKPLAPGRAAETASRPVVLANEDKTSIDAIATAISKTITTATVSVTRPADTNAYAAGDALSNSTTSATGLTFTVVSANGKGGLITDLIVTSSKASNLTGELWLFDTAPGAINDNAAFTITDSEVQTLVAVIPFALVAVGANSRVQVDNVGKAFTCAAGANSLRGLVRVTAAYTPDSAEVVTFRLKVAPVG